MEGHRSNVRSVMSSCDAHCMICKVIDVAYRHRSLASMRSSPNLFIGSPHARRVGAEHGVREGWVSIGVSSRGLPGPRVFDREQLSGRPAFHPSPKPLTVSLSAEAAHSRLCTTGHGPASGPSIDDPRSPFLLGAGQRRATPQSDSIAAAAIDGGARRPCRREAHRVRGRRAERAASLAQTVQAQRLRRLARAVIART